MWYLKMVGKARTAMFGLKAELIACGEATSLFAQEREEDLASLRFCVLRVFVNSRCEGDLFE